jgi:RND superfamily putative drug exporter
LSFKPRGELKQAGVGPAAAVLIDATLIRGVLFAATMGLLGDWNWYLPRRLHGSRDPLANEPSYAPNPSCR